MEFTRSVPSRRSMSTWIDGYFLCRLKRQSLSWYEEDERAAMRICPIRPCAIFCKRISALLSVSSARTAYGRNSSPSSVSVILLLVLLKSLTPRDVSSIFMLCVTAGWEIKNCSAVREKFNVFAADMKIRSCMVSITLFTSSVSYQK